MPATEAAQETLQMIAAQGGAVTGKSEITPYEFTDYVKRATDAAALGFTGGKLTGIGASFTIMLVPLAVLFVTARLAVSLTNLTVAVTCDVCMLLRIKPRTTVVVLLAAVYITYGVPLLAGSAAKLTTLNVLAIILSYPSAIAKAVASSVVAAPMSEANSEASATPLVNTAMLPLDMPVDSVAVVVMAVPFKVMASASSVPSTSTLPEISKDAAIN